MDLLGRLGNHPICWPRTRTRLPYRITMEHPFFTVDEFSKRLSVVRIIIFTLIDCDPRAIHRRRRSVCARAGPNNNRQEQQHPRDPFPLFTSRKSTSWESKSVFHVRKMMYEFAYPNGSSFRDGRRPRGRNPPLPDRSSRLVSRGFRWIFVCLLWIHEARAGRRMPLIHHREPC